ncbi:hypothetical protein MRB53_037791 [Persea americana]|nr:hypothetical protein MRB53_037791 [Persea americana]
MISTPSTVNRATTAGRTGTDIVALSDLHIFSDASGQAGSVQCRTRSDHKTSFLFAFVRRQPVAMLKCITILFHCAITDDTDNQANIWNISCRRAHLVYEILELEPVLTRQRHARRRRHLAILSS